MEERTNSDPDASKSHALGEVLEKAKESFPMLTEPDLKRLVEFGNSPDGVTDEQVLDLILNIHPLELVGSPPLKT